MRQVVLDTETTGLDPKLGHRVIEIAGVEMVNRRLTRRHFHRFLNPDREIAHCRWQQVARLQLKKLNAQLTVLSDQQAAYIGVAKEGPYKSTHYRY